MMPATHPDSVFAKGTVTLVGAGPGDPELLTLKAVRAIASATVILVDDLVNKAVLEHASAGARVIEVGKRGGCKSTPQAFIEQLMVSEAQKGEIVVRLKGGDPMIFGRAGEELAALAKAGVRSYVISGITAGLAAATELKMPLTHRNHAHGVLFVTGHAAPGGEATDWISLGQMAAHNKLTLVIYMGVSSATQIEQGLSTQMQGDTPVILVQHASSKNQRQVRTQLCDLSQCLIDQQLSSPLVMVIGAVAGLADWDSVIEIPDNQWLGSHANKKNGLGYNAQLVA